MMGTPMAERVVPDPAPLVAAAAAALQVETVSDFDSFLDLEPAWNRLLDEAAIDNPFLRHEWFRTWWECFGDGRQLHVLTVRAGRELIAIAPMMLSRERVYGLTVRRLRTIANAHTQRADWIVARGAEDALRALWDGLVSQKALWDVVVLCQVPSGSATLSRVPALAAEGGFRVILARTTDSPCVYLAGRWEDYFNGLARKHRSNLRNRLKRLEQIGPVTLEVIQDGPEVGPALEEGLRIEAAAWKGHARSAILSRPELSLFYRQFAAWAAQRGWLRLQFLNVGGRRIAFGYSLCYKRRLYLLKPGYDPDYARFSPSNILIYLALRDAFASGILAYDLLGANDPWKREWTSEATPHTWLFVFGETPRARALHFAKGHLFPWLKRVYQACRRLTPGLTSRVPER